MLMTLNPFCCSCLIIPSATFLPSYMFLSAITPLCIYTWDCGHRSLPPVCKYCCCNRSLPPLFVLMLQLFITTSICGNNSLPPLKVLLLPSHITTSTTSASTIAHSWVPQRMILLSLLLIASVSPLCHDIVR